MLLAQQQRLGQSPSALGQQRQTPGIGQVQRQHLGSQRRRRHRSAAPPRITAQAGSPFRSSRPDGPGSPFASHAVAADTALPTIPADVLQQQQQQREQQQQAPAVPPLAVQQHELAALLQQLGRAETYEEKLGVLMALPAVRAFFKGSREGRLVARELPGLPAKAAYCLAALPALHQGHVLSLVPTGVPVSMALAQLGAALARVEEFYDSIGGLAGYQLQCLQLLAAAQAEGGSSDDGSAAALPTASSDAGSSVDASLCSSTDDVWPAGMLGGSHSGSSSSSTEFLVPVGLDLASPEQAAAAAAAVAAGIRAVPHMAEIYPLGGAGDRLGLRCEATGEALPTAVLQYCGRPLLESLLRDLQAREYLYWKLSGEQHTTPVALMTSAAKGNHQRVEELLQRADWFGRGASSFRLVQQPLVPMVGAADARWLVHQPLQIMMKPGGHGVIWKLLLDAGVFDWLAAQDRQAAVVRQISNPMAGTDTTLLALAGAGFPARRAFGFASCERAVGAAEGMNVLAAERRLEPADAAAAAPASGASSGATPSGSEASSSSSSTDAADVQRYSWRYRVTNVEYTEFARLGLADASVDEASERSVFPANTNVLYVGLQAVEQAVRASMAAGTTDAVLPGMILNTSKRVSYADPLAGGQHRSLPAGRLECTMQNLADCLAQSFEAPLEGEQGEAAAAGLPTFLVYNQRRKVTSSAKRKLKPGSQHVSQTPDGSFLDLQRNAADMLANHCGVEVPEVGDVARYLAHGPGFVFLHHPALGPLWQVVGQKLRGGSLAPHSEVALEVAEVAWRDVHVAGSLLVRADAPLGHTEQRAAPAGSGAAGPAAAAAAAGGGGAAWLDALLTSSGSGSNGSSMGLGAPVPSAGAAPTSGYSQPCDVTAPPCNESGAATEPRLAFSQRCGRVRLHNVRVRNAGVDWRHPSNVWWRHSLERRESCRVTLRGMSEFEAHDVELSGDLSFEVPDGHRLLVTAGPAGGLSMQLQPLAAPTWEWRYRWGADGGVQLELAELGAPSSTAAAAASAATDS